MSVLRRSLVLAVALAASVVPGTALAAGGSTPPPTSTECNSAPDAVTADTTTADCQAQLSQLRADTVAAQGSFTNAKDFNAAIAKLDAAASKLAEGKSADAAAKIADYQSLLAALAGAPKPKLDPSVAETLSNEAQGVIDCINASSA